MSQSEGLNFEGKVVMIVGATGAIGSGTAQLFAEAGAKLVLAARDAIAGQALAKSLRGSSSNVLFVRCDVTDSSSVERSVAEAADRFGQIDCAFNNAGWEGTGVPTADISEADWSKMIEIKLNGTWYGVKHQIKQMLAQGTGGAIVNMAGNWGLIGFPRYSSYCAAAHGVMGLTRSAALEYASQGIRINAVCPGAVDTPLLSRMVRGDEAAKANFAAAIPIGRLAVPKDVAQAVLWLCSGNAGYVTGQGIVLTGGA